ncbi:MAG TPA: ABC transporter ATP-binding protein, partial [Candidatus Caenarcaniphilales bacterium]
MLWITAILLVPLSVAGAVQPILIGQAISLLRQEPTTLWFLKGKNLSTGINILSGLLLLTVAVRFTLQAIQGYLVQKIGQQITADIRNDLFDHVTALATRFFDRTPVGQLITRLTNDVEALGDVFSTGAIGIVSDLLSIVVIAITMFTLQWQLALMLVLMLLPVTGLILYFQYQYRKANYKAREELSVLNSTLQENIVGIGVVQLFQRERFNAQLFQGINRRYITEVDKTIFHDAAVSSTLEWIAFIAIAGVLGLGGVWVMGETLTFGTLSTFILFAQRLFDPLRQLAEKFTAIQAGFTAVERISGIMNQPVEIRDPEYPQSLPLATAKTVQGEIRFEHVWFAYQGDDFVLKDLNFVIEPGEKVALVGPTGSGKSSIIRLLSRLYETTRGRILVDGVDVRELPQTELRRHIGVI